MNNKINDLIIIGGGPAGINAAIYAARKKLNTVIIADAWGGQSMVSEDIQNWLGFPHVSGTDMSKKLEDHLRLYEGDVLKVDYPNLASKVTKDSAGIFSVITKNDTEYKTKTILLATGATRRKLPAKNADIFDHKGLTYCASCDGPLFSGRDLIVVGGGNAGFETAAQLLAYAKSVTLLEYGDKFVADEVTVEKIHQNEKFKSLKNVEVKEILGDKFVTGVKYINRISNEEATLDTGGVFVEIGMVPNTSLVKDIVELDSRGRVPVDHQTQKAGTEGVWAAGDCTDILYHQNSIAMGDAVKALEDIYLYLNS